MGQLNDDRFEAREQAQAELRRRITDPKTAGGMARRLQAALLGGSLPVETSVAIETLLKLAPEPPPLPAALDPDAAALAALVRQLDDDAYAARRSAAGRLDVYGRELRLAARLLAPLRGALRARTRTAPRMNCSRRSMPMRVALGWSTTAKTPACRR